jgi:hypothetical protein
MTDEPEALTPEMAKEEVAEMNADKDHPLHDSGHPRHLDAIDRLTELLIAQDAPPVERYSETGEHSTADLDARMADAMAPVESPEGYSFDAFDRSEDAEWNTDEEAEFRQVFHNAGLSQPEADQLMTIASSGVPVNAGHTESVLNARYEGNEEAKQKDIALAKAAVLKAGGEPLANWLNETGYGDHLAFFDMALRKGKEWELEA